MRRILISTTALSVALTQIAPYPVVAQTLTEDGSVIAEDGTVLCLGTVDVPCDLNAVLEELAAQKAAEEAAAAEAAAQAEAAAAAQAEADAAAQAEAEAAAQAEAEAAAAAEAEAQRAADEAAAAEAAAQAEAEAAAQAEAEAAAAAEAEALRAAEEAAAAEAAAQAEAEAAAAEAAAAQEAVIEEIVPTEPTPGAEAGAETVATEEAALPQEPTVGADGQPIETFVAEQPTDLVDPAATEVPTVEAIETLSTLLTQPEPEAMPALEAMAAAEVAPAAVAGEAVDITPAETAANVVFQEITADTARTSAQDFTSAATANLATATASREDGLTDLQKFGLVALGALAVGAIINANRDQVVSNTGDRVVVRRGDGDYYVYKDDDTLLRRPGSTVRTETFRDGSTRTVVERGDGTQIVTIRDATGRVLRRATYDELGREVVFIDDLYPEERIDFATLPKPRGRVISMSTSEEDALLMARMAAAESEDFGRSFSLRQIREIPQVRQLAATVDVNNITFDSGSAAIKANQAESLAALGRFMRAMIRENPNEIFLIEGHTDAVGPSALNLTLSDRRAESVALALSEYFDVPPENMVVQGYGESELRIETLQAERQNRRVAVRIITPLLRTADLR